MCHTAYTLAASSIAPRVEGTPESRDPLPAPVCVVIFITSSVFLDSQTISAIGEVLPHPDHIKNYA